MTTTLTDAYRQAERVSAIVRQITYKPGSKFECSLRNDTPVVTVLFIMQVPDVRNPEEPAGVYRVWNVEVAKLAQLSDANLMLMVRTEVWRMVWDAEDHEIDEWLKIDGIHFEEPRHP